MGIFNAVSARTKLRDEEKRKPQKKTTGLSTIAFQLQPATRYNKSIKRKNGKRKN
jgi:hypothetical protein